MGIFALLNPKQAAADAIAREISAGWDDQHDGTKRLIERKLKSLKTKDEGLYRMVVEELRSDVMRISSDR